MTAKKFRKSVETLNGFRFWDNALIAAMGLCLMAPVPFAFVNYNILTVFRAMFAVTFYFWDYYHIELDPAYPVSQRKSSDGQDPSLANNRKIIIGAAVFPGTRKTAVKAYQNKRFAVSLILTAGLVIQGIMLLRCKELIHSTPLILSDIFIVSSYCINYIAIAIGKCLGSSGARRITDTMILSCSFAALTQINRDIPDDKPMGAGVIMLFNAFITLLVSLICYFKCLRDAENTARNGEKIGEIKK
ncbi:MAG: hypothetical protein ACI4RG_11060 [Huintestinicola sp.]